MAALSGLSRLEDRILWAKVARTTTPLKGRSVPKEERPGESDLMSEAMNTAATVARSCPSASPSHPRKTKPHQFRLDEPTHRKLAKGSLAISARIDLHGLTQGDAHGLLHSFLHRAHTAGLRHVLVITGKGSSFGSDGILRQAVPQWFATPAFRSLVSAYDFAHQSHGGAGAIYVRLRRDTEMRKT
jgi:DNA-nicking Smr family endonuclease